MIDCVSVLFLLRSYNDIDHIVPIIWKCNNSGLRCYFVFTDVVFSTDYRIQFIVHEGAIYLHSRPLTTYYQRIRAHLGLRIVRRILDTFVEYLIGARILTKNNIDVIVTEWSGALGRDMSRYYLRPALNNQVPIYSVPHGYNIYRNFDLNQTVKDRKKNTGKWPDFSSRNAFSRYVVQHEATKNYCMAFGVKKENIAVLGSARFCREWVDVNNHLLEGCLNIEGQASCKIVFFLPQWDYNVDRSACLELLLALSRIPDVLVMLKGTTREIGGLYEAEKLQLGKVRNVKFAENSIPSPALIRWSDLVINFASSIGLEAIMQKKLVCNPRYLHTNDSIFDDSGVVIDCFSSDAVEEIVIGLMAGVCSELPKSNWREFYEKYIQGEGENDDVLKKYVDLIKTGRIGPEKNRNCD